MVGVADAPADADVAVVVADVADAAVVLVVG